MGALNNAEQISKLQQPIARLLHLSDTGSSGELIVVGNGMEIRLYLVSGRLAWATSSHSRFAFTTYLIEDCGVSKSTIQEAVKTCRETKRPLGEWLVECAGVTTDQVRHALRRQVESAILDLNGLGDHAQALFIPKSDSSDKYKNVTFDLKEFLPNDSFQSEAEPTLFLMKSIESTDTETKQTSRSKNMSKVNLAPLSEMDGYMAAALVDSSSGMVMGTHGNSPFPLDVAAAGNTEVVRAKRKTMRSLGLAEKIEDILISLGGQYHIIRPLETNDAVFMYVVLDRAKANLAMARHTIRDFEKKTAI